MSKLKALMEKRAALQEQMERIVEVADAENRAMSEEEMGNFDAAEKEIKAIDETIEREERARNLERNMCIRDSVNTVVKFTIKGLSVGKNLYLIMMERQQRFEIQKPGSTKENKFE